MTRVEDGLSLQNLENNIKKIKAQLRDTRSGSQKYQQLTHEMGRLEKKINMGNSEDCYQENEVRIRNTFTLGTLCKFK